MNEVKVTVIIPAYNAATTLRRAVESVTRQDFDEGLEIIIVDDGSTDDTAALARSLASSHDNITVISKSNGGQMSARQAGVRAARGQWLMHLDADDTLVAGAISGLYRRALDYDLDYIAGNLNTQYKPGGPFIRETRPYAGVVDGTRFLERVLRVDGNLPNWGSLSKRELWLEDAFPTRPTRVPAEDRLLNVGIAAHIVRAAVTNDVPVVNYHAEASSVTASGAHFKQSLWREHFAYLRSRLGGKHESAVRLLEIDALAFHCRIDDKDDKWYKAVTAYPTTNMPAKYRVLARLIRYPAICHRVIAIHRRLKSALSRRSR